MKRLAEAAALLFGAALLAQLAMALLVPLVPSLGGLAIVAGAAYWMFGRGGPHHGGRGGYR